MSKHDFAAQLSKLKTMSFQTATNMDALESQYDTVQGGKWGDYITTPQPSQQAIDLKEIVKTNGIALIIYRWECTMPDEAGDGIGFPAGFGNWWRTL